VNLEYDDQVQLIITGVDGYGTETVADEGTVDAAIEWTTGSSHSRNQSAVTGDIRMYIDPENDFVQKYFFRLEGALVIAQPFGASLAQSWFRVASVEVARSHQLDNEIDNVLLTLNKSAGIEGVS
jgi:hypothetical protein